MVKYLIAIGIIAWAIIMPENAAAQDVAGYIGGLQGVLDQLYDEMIPLCSQLIGVGRGLAGFAASWYIGYRVWSHIARAEPIDFYPLMRPFALGLAVLLFPAVLGIINGVMKPTVTATSGMVQESDKAIRRLLEEKEKAIKETDAWQMYVGDNGEGDRDKWYKYAHPDGGEEGMFEEIGNDIRFQMSKASYNFRNSVKEFMAEVLRIIYQAAALCINTIRTFHLIVLAILGPLVIGMAVFDGFHHTLTVWLARYLNIFLWLPVANIFGSIIGKIQEKMLELDIQQVQEAGDTFFSSTDAGYLIFMIIAIVGYFTVPSVANYIVNAGGSSALLHKATNMFGSSTSTALSTVTPSYNGMAADALGNAANRQNSNMAGYAASSGYFNEGSGQSGSSGKNRQMKDKLSGKSDSDGKEKEDDDNA
jgi:conjugative transposon TraJ protein